MTENKMKVMKTKQQNNVSKNNNDENEVLRQLLRGNAVDDANNCVSTPQQLPLEMSVAMTPLQTRTTQPRGSTLSKVNTTKVNSVSSPLRGGSLDRRKSTGSRKHTLAENKTYERPSVINKQSILKFNKKYNDDSIFIISQNLKKTQPRVGRMSEAIEEKEEKKNHSDDDDYEEDDEAEISEDDDDDDGDDEEEDDEEDDEEERMMKDGWTHNDSFNKRIEDGLGSSLTRTQTFPIVEDNSMTDETTFSSSNQLTCRSFRYTPPTKKVKKMIPKQPDLCFCYICSKRYTPASLPFHEKICLQLWNKLNQKRPLCCRRCLPTNPEIVYQDHWQTFTKKKIKRLQWEAAISNRVQCRYCNKRFCPFNIDNHEALCKKINRTDPFHQNLEKLQQRREIFGKFTLKSNNDNADFKMYLTKKSKLERSSIKYDDQYRYLTIFQKKKKKKRKKKKETVQPVIEYEFEDPERQTTKSESLQTQIVSKYIPETDVWQKVKDWQDKSALQLNTRASFFTYNDDLQDYSKVVMASNDQLKPHVEFYDISGETLANVRSVSLNPQTMKNYSSTCLYTEAVKKESECDVEETVKNETKDVSEVKNDTFESKQEGVGGEEGENKGGERGGNNNCDDADLKEKKDTAVNSGMDENGDEMFKLLYPAPTMSVDSSGISKNSLNSIKRDNKMTWADFNWKVLKESFPSKHVLSETSNAC